MAETPNRYGAGSASADTKRRVGRGRALPNGLVQEHGRGDADVQRLHPPGERDGDGRVAGLAHERPDPPPLGAEDERQPAAELCSPHRLTVERGRVDPQRRALHLPEPAGEVGDDRHRQVLDRAGRRAAHRRRHPRRPVRRQHDAGRAGAFGAPAHRPEVARVGDLVEADEERPVGRSQLVRVRVAVGLAAGDEALVLARAGELGQLPLRADLHAPPVQPRLPGGARRREHLEHLAPAVERLPHRTPAVDKLAAHGRGTSS